MPSRDSFAEFRRSEIVPIFLTNDDQMCLRRLTERDVHEPSDLTASEAQSGVVGAAIQWVASTLSKLAHTQGELVLRYPGQQDQNVDWAHMFAQSINDEAEPNIEISLQDAVDIAMADALRELWERILEREVSRSALIRFAIRWRHYCLRMYLGHEKKKSNPQLGIVFGEGQKRRFIVIAI